MSEEEIRDIIRDELSNFLGSDRYTFQKHLQLFDGRNIQVGKGTGTKFGTETTQKLGWWNKSPVVQPTNGVDLTNNVTSGGTNDQIDNYTDLSTYATDANAIRNNIYQLARKVKIINDALRLMGLMS